jgi:hypothetical protein
VIVRPFAGYGILIDRQRPDLARLYLIADDTRRNTLD